MKRIHEKFHLLLFLMLIVAIDLSSGCYSNPEDEVDDDVNTADSLNYPIVGTAQELCYNTLYAISPPSPGEAFFGQDAQFSGNDPVYTTNGDGTITDEVTGLIWQQSPDINGDGNIDIADKLTFSEALTYAQKLELGGKADWRLPSIKELYSLILFTGKDPSGYEGSSTVGLVPFIDTDHFSFAYGDTEAGERLIDAQFASSTYYVDASQNLLFGVNFADGRIKGYGLQHPMGGEKTFYVLCVRGNESYGENSFLDNGDGTVTDQATGLMWMQSDSGEGMDWQEALAYAESNKTAGFDDWRLPDVKELQSIVDYTRSPATHQSAAIDPVFQATGIVNEGGVPDFAAYWSSTTHANWTEKDGGNAAYVCFGRAMGYMMGSWRDVHGAGAQRSDPKTGDASQWPYGHGPQGDAIRIQNKVRLVRNLK